MKRMMIAAMSSGSGKTVVSCALMRAFARRGLSVRAFKCGPDYIDPMFHRKVLGIPSRNLDLFLQGRDGVQMTLADGYAQHTDLAIVESAMGYYDGINGTDQASAWQIARETQTPVLLVLRPGGQSTTLAAQVLGMLSFRRPSFIAALLLTGCSAKMYRLLRPVLEKETGLPVIGYLPKMDEAVLPSRHLGLITAEEIAHLSARFDVIAEALEQHADLDMLLRRCEEKKFMGSQESCMKTRSTVSHGSCTDTGTAVSHGSCTETKPTAMQELCAGNGSKNRLPGRGGRIAVARDEAFSFYYEDNLEALRNHGAETIFFSPLHDVSLPDADGLYLGGGYPELYVKELSENRSMRKQICSRILSGMPTVAECGGFLYLQQFLQDDGGHRWPMAGVLPGSASATKHLQRFGYLTLHAETDSLLLREGESVPAHEFHYWESTDCGQDLAARKPDGTTWRCGFAKDNLYAAFPHLYWGGSSPMAERFAAAAARYAAEKHQM